MWLYVVVCVVCAPRLKLSRKFEIHLVDWFWCIDGFVIGQLWDRSDPDVICCCCFLTVSCDIFDGHSDVTVLPSVHRLLWEEEVNEINKMYSVGYYVDVSWPRSVFFRIFCRSPFHLSTLRLKTPFVNFIKRQISIRIIISELLLYTQKLRTSTYDTRK